MQMHNMYIFQRTKPLYTLKMMQLVYHSHWHSKTSLRAGSKGAYGNMEDFPREQVCGFFWKEGREGLGQAYQEDFEVLRLSNSLM